jgi:hypothetical protein
MSTHIAEACNDYDTIEEVTDMPRRDGTGPSGLGPMTGRANGNCDSNVQPGRLHNPGINTGVRRGAGQGALRGNGNGLGRGLGLGRAGRRRQLNWLFPSRRRSVDDSPGVPPGNLDREAEREALKTQADEIEQNLEMIRKRISDLGEE